jgi:hypothetical protein
MGTSTTSLPPPLPESEPEPTQQQQPPPATTHYWTSDATRRLEYAAIDAASRGVKGWVLRHVVPDCFVPRSSSSRRHVGFDDDCGSVRRYRLDLPADDDGGDDDGDDDGGRRDSGEQGDGRCCKREDHCYHRSEDSVAAGYGSEDVSGSDSGARGRAARGRGKERKQEQQHQHQRQRSGWRLWGRRSST